MMKYLVDEWESMDKWFIVSSVDCFVVDLKHCDTNTHTHTLVHTLRRMGHFILIIESINALVICTSHLNKSLLSVCNLDQTG